ncbi:MAG: DUF2484 family protein [Pseudomonadota bacterium]
MNAAVVLSAFWVMLGTGVALSPRAYHPPGALMLLTLLIPILPYMAITVPWLAVLFFLGAVSILRWPIYYIGRHMLRSWGVRLPLDEIERSL